MHDVFNIVTPPNGSNLFTYSLKLHHHNTRFSAASNFYIKHSRTDHMEIPFSVLVQRYGIVFPTVIVLYLDINLRISYRAGYWIL